MSDIQKSTYTELILTKIYAEDEFLAESITLDYLYSIDNYHLAISKLADALKEDNKYACLGIKCICGIILAVEKFTFQMSMITDIKFVETLMSAVKYKINDTALSEYVACMEKIFCFISKNINLKLLNDFFSLIDIFMICDWNFKENKEVFAFYCKSLSRGCKKLRQEDEEKFMYSISKIRKRYLDIDGEDVLKTFKDILKSYDEKNILYIFSNDNDLANREYIEQNKKNLYASVDRIDNIEEIVEMDNICILFIINFKENNWNYMMYYFGMMKATLKERASVQFHNENIVNTEPKFMKILDSN